MGAVWVSRLHNYSSLVLLNTYIVVMILSLVNMQKHQPSPVSLQTLFLSASCSETEPFPTTQALAYRINITYPDSFP